MGNLRPFRRSVARGKDIRWDRCRRGRRRQIVILGERDSPPIFGGSPRQPKPKGMGRRLLGALRSVFGRRGSER